jgi:DNA polymerase-1
MGILATCNQIIEGEKVIVSEDKDMMTIPSLLWRQGEMLDISEEEADYNHLLQTLKGDTTDGYSGLRGVGEVKAKTILKVPVWKSVEDAFIKAGYTKEDALVQARLARILRAEDYNFEFDQPREWSPK